MADFEPWDRPDQHYDGGPSGSGQELQSKPKKRLAAILIPCVAVVAAAGVCFAAFGSGLLAKLSPEKSLRRAMEKTNESMASYLKDTPHQALAEFVHALEGGTLSADFSYDDGIDSLDGSVGLSCDLEETAVGLSADLTLDGQPMGGNLYLDRACAALGLSFLPETYGLTYETFEEDLRASALPDYFGLTEDDITEAAAAVEEFREAMGSESGASALEDAREDFWDSLDFEVSTENVELSGEDVRCTAYAARISEDAISKLSHDLAPDEAGDQLEQLLSLYAGADVIFYVNGGCMTGAELHNTADWMGMDFTLDLLFDLGAKPEEGKWSLSASLQPEGESKVEVLLDYAPKSSGDVFSDQLEVTAAADGEKYVVTLGTEWERESGDWSFSVMVDSISVALHGKLTITGTVCELSFEDIGKQLAALTGDEGALFSFKLRSEKGHVPERPSFVNLDQIDEAALDDIALAIEDFSSLFYGGETSADYSDYDYDDFDDDYYGYDDFDYGDFGYDDFDYGDFDYGDFAS